MVYWDQITEGGTDDEFRKQFGPGPEKKRQDPGGGGGEAGVSRQTISKWELDETLPDINQSKKLAVFYHLTLDQLIGFDVEAAELEQVIENTSQEVREKIDWTQLWAKQYPVLAQYQERVDLPSYTGPLAALLDRLRQEQGYNEQDAFLVLKDILGQMRTKGAAR